MHVKFAAPRERGIALVVSAQLLKYVLTVEASVLVAFPRVHGIGFCIQAKAVYDLAKAKVGKAATQPELNHNAKANSVHKPKGKRPVFEPS